MPARFELADAVAVFHQWIRDGVCPEMLIDVADYRHVPAGPGVLLIGHRGELQPWITGRIGWDCCTTARLPLDGTFQSGSNRLTVLR